MPAPLLSGDLPANHVPTAGMLNTQTVKEKRRAEKMRELRQYMVDSGVVEAVVKMLVGIQEMEYRPPDAPDLLKDFFGDHRDPLWDEIEKERNHIDSGHEKIKGLRNELTSMKANLDTATKARDGRKLFNVIAAKVNTGEDPLTVLTSAQVKEALTGKKAKPPMDVELPDEIQKSAMEEFFKTLDAEGADLEFARNLSEEIESAATPPYEKDAQNEELANLFDGLAKFIAANPAEEEEE